MKKMLFISSRPPFPLVGGDKIRFYNTIKILSSVYIVDILFLYDDKTLIKEPKYITDCVNNIYSFHKSKLSSYIDVIWGLFVNKLPLQINYYKSKAVNKWLCENYHEYDFLFCNHIRTTEYVTKINVDKYVDLVDSLSLNYTKAYSNSSGVWKLIYKIEKQRVKDYEREILHRFKKSFLISSVDRDFILDDSVLLADKISVIPNFVDDCFLIDSSKDSIRDFNIGFLGKMNYEPNVNAVKWFVNNVFPTLKCSFPNIKFYIIGAFPTKDILNLSDKNIIVTGFVEDLSLYIDKCSVFVAPMISGAGVQNKILQLMYNSKPVVTTKIGAEGLDNLNGNELLITDDAEEFADLIFKLLNDIDFNQFVGENAYKYICNNLSYKIVKEQLLYEIS